MGGGLFEGGGLIESLRYAVLESLHYDATQPLSRECPLRSFYCTNKVYSSIIAQNR